jgi:hypothetical protein
MLDALEARYGVFDAGSELYVMEQFHDYRMIEDRPVVEQAHKIQALMKELELFGCVLPDKLWLVVSLQSCHNLGLILQLP